MSTDMKGSEMKESNLPDVPSRKLSRGKVSTAAREVLHRQITSEWPSAAMRGDIQRYLDFLTDDMVFMPPNHTAIVDKEALREWLNRAFASATFDITIHEPVEIVVTGEWAFARYRVSVAGTTTAGHAFKTERKYVDIWRQAVGAWKCHRHIWNDDLPL
jgi:ketosteroid isomerase-like protein